MRHIAGEPQVLAGVLAVNGTLAGAMAVQAPAGWKARQVGATVNYGMSRLVMRPSER